MQEGHVWSSWHKIFLRAAEVLAAAVAGAWIASLLPLRQRDPELNFLVMSAIVGISIVMYVVILQERKHSANVAILARKVTELTERRGCEADLVIEAFPAERGQYFRDLTSLLSGTRPGDEIRVMTFQAHAETDWERQEESYTEAQTEYFKMLLKKAREGVKYRRLVCFVGLHPGAPIPLHLMRDHMREHCIDLLMLPQHNKTLVVKKAAAELMADVLLINKSAAAVTLESPVKDQHVFTAGALIAHNPPNPLIIERLEEIWARLWDSSSVLELSELHPDKTRRPVA